MTVTIHNIGVVDSIALAVYLAADVRVTNPDATFLVHDIFFTQPMPVTNRHQAADISAGLEGSRTRFMELLKLRTHMSDEQFEQFKFLDQLSIKSAVTAHETGIAHSVQQAVVPPGTELFNVEY